MKTKSKKSIPIIPKPIRLSKRGVANEGRPKMEIDETLVERLAAIHCPNVEIAAACNCSVDTLMNRFSEIIAKGREKGRTSLRRFQWTAASKGNVVMMIWLGKQLLGQTDKQAIDLKTELDPNAATKDDIEQMAANLLNAAKIAAEAK